MGFTIPIEPYLYTVKTNRELYNKYIEALQTCGPLNWNIANQIKEYISQESKSFLTFTAKTQSDISNLLQKFAPVSYTVTGRKKTFYSFCKKLEEISPSLIKDTYALRVITSSNALGEDTAVEFCYAAAKSILDSFFKMGWKACPLEEKKEKNELSKDLANCLFIPTPPNYISDYQVFMKDYIAHPKANGYQSLHLLLTDCKTGNSIEIQIRTSDMHKHAENGDASHKKVYKPKTVDCSRIMIDESEFNYDPESDTIILDKHGLIKPLQIGENCLVEKPNDPIDWL